MEWLRKLILSYFRVYLVFFVLFASNNYANQIYTCTDANGNTLYTDSPEKDPNCTNPKVKQLKSLPILPKGVGPSSNTVRSNNSSTNHQHNTEINPTSSEGTKQYSSININTPVNGETINRCGGLFETSFATNPSLYSGDQIEIIIDGSRHGRTTGSSYSISGFNPGNHSLMLQVMRNGKVVQSSASISFNFLRNCVKRTEKSNNENNNNGTANNKKGFQTVGFNNYSISPGSKRN